MNTTNLQKNLNLLIEYIQHEADLVIRYGGEFNDYDDYYLNFIKPSLRNPNSYYRKSYLTVIYNFDLFNRLPNRRKNEHRLVYKSYYEHLNDEYKKIVDNYQLISRLNGKKDSTIKCESYNAACFFYYLQNICNKSLYEITESDVLGFFVDENNNPKFSCSYKKNISAVIKANIPSNDECKKIVGYLPRLKEIRKNIQYLTYDEIMCITNILNEKDNNVTCRSKAIVSLLLYTGIRGCDIKNLQLENIDWRNEKIQIVQSKTEAPLELPLLVPVGNAIYEYLIHERPSSNLKFVFLQENGLYPIGKSSIDLSVRQVMNASNIRMNKGDRRGSHIFRHHLAASLLSIDTPSPVISQILGHTAPDSLDTYLHSDFVHLKMCALSIERFPLTKQKGGASNDSI